MNSDAIPPKMPSIVDFLRRPLAAEIRSAPVGRVVYTDPRPYCERSMPPEGDDDPPRMSRIVLATGTSSGPNGFDYYQASQRAVVSGRPYVLDLRVWDAESAAIAERLTHDYNSHEPTR